MGRGAASLCITLLKSCPLQASFSLRVWTTAWAGWGRIHTSPFTSEAAQHQTGFSCWVRLEKSGDGCKKKKKTREREKKKARAFELAPGRHLSEKRLGSVCPSPERSLQNSLVSICSEITFINFRLLWETHEQSYSLKRKKSQFINCRLWQWALQIKIKAMIRKEKNKQTQGTTLEKPQKWTKISHQTRPPEWETDTQTVDCQNIMLYNQITSTFYKCNYLLRNTSLMWLTKITGVWMNSVRQQWLWVQLRDALTRAGTYGGTAGQKLSVSGRAGLEWRHWEPSPWCCVWISTHTHSLSTLQSTQSCKWNSRLFDWMKWFCCFFCFSRLARQDRNRTVPSCDVMHNIMQWCSDQFRSAAVALWGVWVSSPGGGFTRMRSCRRSWRAQWQRPARHTWGTCSPAWKCRPLSGQTASLCSPLERGNREGNNKQSASFLSLQILADKCKLLAETSSSGMIRTAQVGKCCWLNQLCTRLNIDFNHMHLWLCLQSQMHEVSKNVFSPRSVETWNWNLLLNLSKNM